MKPAVGTLFSRVFWASALAAKTFFLEIASFCHSRAPATFKSEPRFLAPDARSFAAIALHVSFSNQQNKSKPLEKGTFREGAAASGISGT